MPSTIPPIEMQVQKIDFVPAGHYSRGIEIAVLPIRPSWGARVAMGWQGWQWHDSNQHERFIGALVKPKANK
jgi:hypothetical protein